MKIQIQNNYVQLVKIQLIVFFLSIFLCIKLSGQEILYFDNFDTPTQSWTFEGQNSGGSIITPSWEIGEPSGGKGYYSFLFWRGYVGNADPAVDVSDNRVNYVLGQGLGESSYAAGVASYTNNSIETATSPVFDCSGFNIVTLNFWRWLNVENNQDEAYVEISTDGSTWVALDHPLYAADNSWVEVEIDISEFAANESLVQLRWKTESGYFSAYSGWNIDDVLVTGANIESVEWNGSVSGDWNTPQNWSPAIVPNKAIDVFISSTSINAVEISNDAQAKNVTINNNGILIVNETASLMVSGDLNINNEGGTPIFLEYGNVDVSGVVNWTNTLDGNRWMIISSPLANVPASALKTTVYRWDEPSAKDNWAYGWVKESGLLESTLGYYIRYKNQTTVNFSGDLNTSNQIISLTNTDGLEVSDHEGWNIAGNPYTCYLDWDACQKDNLVNAVYLWDEDLGVYKVYMDGVSINGGTRYIAPGEGFFVKVSQPGSYTFETTNEAKSAYSGNTNLKRSTKGGILTVVAKNDYYSDETVIRFSDYATEAYDEGIDAVKKFSENDFVPQIYTKSNYSNFVINSVPPTNKHIAIPLGVQSEISIQTTLEFRGIDNLGEDVYLEDKVAGKLVLINGLNEYSFKASKYDIPERFVIHMGNPMETEIFVADETCAGKADAVLKANVADEELISSYNWSNGESTKEIKGISSGIYQLTIIDVYGNEYKSEVVVNTLSSPDFDIDATVESIVGSNDGSISLTPQNININYTYTWSTGENTKDIYNLSSGVYVVEIEDEYGCVSTKSFELTGEALDINEYTTEFNVYQSNEMLVVSIPNYASMGMLSIMDVTGKVLTTSSFNGDYTEFDVELAPGIYVISLDLENETLSTKLFFK